VVPEEGQAMFAITIRFTMPDDTDWEEVRAEAVRRAFEVYRNVPGLRSKAFLFAPERGEYGGNYVWETQDDAEAFLQSAGWERLVSQLGEPRIERSEICAYVECGDLVWPADYAPAPAVEPSASMDSAAL
jgi:hypothetical protein